MRTKLSSDVIRLLRLISLKENKNISAVLEEAINSLLPNAGCEYKDIIKAKRKLQNEKEALNFNTSSIKYRKINRYVNRINDITIIYKVRQISTGLVYIGTAKGIMTKRMKEHRDTDDMVELFDAMLDSEITDWEFKILATTANRDDVQKKKEYYIKKYNARKAGFNHE